MNNLFKTNLFFYFYTVQPVTWRTLLVITQLTLQYIHVYILKYLITNTIYIFMNENWLHKFNIQVSLSDTIYPNMWYVNSCNVAFTSICNLNLMFRYYPNIIVTTQTSIFVPFQNILRNKSFLQKFY